MATVSELRNSWEVVRGPNPTVVRRFLVDLPPNQAGDGAHIGVGAGQLPPIGAPTVVGSTTLFAASYRIRGVGVSHSEIEVPYTFDGGTNSPINPLALDYQPFQFESGIGFVEIPYVRKVQITPGRFEYPETVVKVARPEVVVTLTVNIPIVGGLPDINTLAAITAETGKKHTIAGQNIYLFLGGSGTVETHDRFQVTYAWKGVPVLDAPELPSPEYLNIPTLYAHEHYIVVPGASVSAYATDQAQADPPVILTVAPFSSGNIANLPGVL